MKEIHEKLKKNIIDLCSVMSVSGFEPRASEELREKLAPHFDEYRRDAVGNHMFIKRCGKEDAPLCLVDTHFDEVGMIVTEICDKGFLRFTQIGGLSLAVLQAADVTVYGKKTVRGVITSTPPHLRGGSSDELEDMDKLLIDTGYSKETLEEIAPVGTPIGFSPCYGELLNGQIMGKSFDNKACAAICATAIMDAKKEDLACDVALLLSAYEETSRLGGVATGVFSLSPDYAMVVDVNLARVPDTPKYETVPLGEGISLALSPCTSRALTMASKKLCEEKSVAYVTVAAPSSTGTNSPTVNLVGEGVPVVDVGLPLKNMHTYNETISLDDAYSLYRFTAEFIKSRDIANSFAKSGEELPL